jgi:hypothetical protein
MLLRVTIYPSQEKRAFPCIFHKNRGHCSKKNDKKENI